jgi:hypothetical protein
MVPYPSPEGFGAVEGPGTQWREKRVIVADVVEGIDPYAWSALLLDCQFLVSFTDGAFWVFPVTRFIAFVVR